MPFITVENQKIHYFANNGSDDTTDNILFIHGNSGSINAWEKQLNDPIMRLYHLVAIDLPGHGLSGHSETPELTYTIDGFTRIVAEIIIQLSLSKCVIIGHSLGGHIAIETLPLLKNQIKGILISGAPPLIDATSFQYAALPNPAIAAAFTPEVIEDTLEDFFNASFNDRNSIPPSLKIDFKQTDPMVREFLGKSIQEGKINNEIGILQMSNIPVCIVTGEQDGFINPEYLKSVQITKWKNKLITIPNAGHYPHIENPDVFNSTIVEFAAYCFA